MTVLRFLQGNGRLTYFAFAMVFAGVANALLFLVLGRMRSLGVRVGLWRTGRDWALYRQYWRIAPQQSWSRAPIVVAALSFAIACFFLWFSMHGIRVPR